MLRLGTRYKQNRYAIYIFYNLTAFDPKFYVIYVSFCKVFKGVGFSCMKKVILNFFVINGVQYIGPRNEKYIYDYLCKKGKLLENLF